MGCGGSKHGSHGKGRSNSVEDSYTARRQRVSVRIGTQVRRLDSKPNIIFIFGKKLRYLQNYICGFVWMYNVDDDDVRTFSNARFLQGCYRYFPKVLPIFDIDAGFKSIVDTDIDTLP